MDLLGNRLWVDLQLSEIFVHIGTMTGLKDYFLFIHADAILRSTSAVKHLSYDALEAKNFEGLRNFILGEITFTVFQI